MPTPLSQRAIRHSMFIEKHFLSAFILGGIAIVVLYYLSITLLRPHQYIIPEMLATLFMVIALIWGIFVSIYHYSVTIRQINDSLQDFQVRYERLLDSGNQAVMIFPFTDGAAGKFNEINTFATLRTGFNTAELKNLTLADIIAPDRFYDVRALLDELALRQSCLLETIFIAKNGNRIPVELFTQVIDINQTSSVVVYARDISDPKRVEEALREVRSTYLALKSNSFLGIIVLDRNGNVTEWNRAAETIFGWREYELFGSPLPIILGGQRSEFLALCDRVFKKESLTQISTHLARKTGELVSVSLSAVPAIDQSGEVSGIVLGIVDISEQDSDREELRRIVNILELTSEIKKAMFRATYEDELLQNVCKNLVAIGRFRMAWIGLLGHDRMRTLQPVAWEGEKAKYLETLRLSCLDYVPGGDPVVLAVCSGTVVKIPHLLLVADDATWLAESLSNGSGSLLAIPLMNGNQALGVLVVTSNRSDGITNDQTELLTEIADDMVYGLEALRARNELHQSIAALQNSVQQWDQTFNAIQHPLCVVDTSGRVTRSNNAITTIFQHTASGAANLHICDLMHGMETPPEDCAYMRMLNSQSMESETISIGGKWYNVTVDPIIDTQGCFHGAVHVMNDITDIKISDEHLQRNYLRLQNIINDTINAIAKIVEMRDPYTAGHEQRVSRFSCEIARELGLSEERIEGLRVAGMLHDIGKIFVPAEMLCKTGDFSDIEFSIIKAHPKAGYDILATIDFPWPVATIVYQHHERMDGSGYPNGLTGEDILLEARILAVADTVESMASHRPYRPALGLEIAMEEISQRASSKFDQTVVQASIKLLAENRSAFDEQMDD